MAAVSYYGLWDGPHDVGDSNWRAFTMLGGPSLPFQECRLAHIIPASTPETVVNDVAEFLHLDRDPMFLTTPRAYLLLPSVLEKAYDRDAVIFCPL